MKLALIISLALNLLLIFLIWERETERGITVKDLELQVRHHKSNADSLATRYDSLLAHDEEMVILYGNSMERASNAEQRALRSEIDLRVERQRNRRFSDAQTDSLLLLVR